MNDTNPVFNRSLKYLVNEGFIALFYTYDENNRFARTLVSHPRLNVQMDEAELGNAMVVDGQVYPNSHPFFVEFGQFCDSVAAMDRKAHEYCERQMKEGEDFYAIIAPRLR